MHLDFELCDRQQNVLTRLDNRRAGGRVEIGLDAMRSAFCPLSLEDPAYDLAAATETLLRVTLKGPEEFSLPLFIGRILIPENGSQEEGEQLGLNAVDPLFQLGKALIREAAGSVWSAKTFSATDQSAIMWALIASATTHGVIEGDLPASINRDRTYLPGKEIGRALIEMTEVINGPDFELEPVAGTGTDTMARFNTFYPRQGGDLSADVIFVYGASPSTASAFSYAPGGDGIVNRVVVVGAPLNAEGEEEPAYAVFPAYVAEHLESIEEYGVFEEVIQLEDVTEGATLKAHAEAVIASRAYPIPYFDFTAAPEQGTHRIAVPPTAELIAEQLTDLLVTDTLKHSAMPVTFTQLPWAGTAGTWSASTGWNPGGFVGTYPAGSRSGVFWNARPLTDGRAVVGFQKTTGALSSTRQFSVWLFSEAGATPSGYQLAVIAESATKVKFILRKWVAGSETILAEVAEVAFAENDYIFLTAYAGKLGAWHQSGEAIPALLKEVEDDTFTSGYSCFDGNGSNPKLDNFISCALESATAEVGDTGNGVPPRFGIDYWIGDTIACHAYLGDRDEPLEVTGRITDATVIELESGQIAVKVSCSPEVNSAGVTGKAITLKVPEVAE